jgi:hypothetical protein
VCVYLMKMGKSEEEDEENGKFSNINIEESKD